MPFDGLMLRAAPCARLRSWRQRSGEFDAIRHGASPPPQDEGGDSAYCAAAVKIDFGIMPWMPLVPSTTCVT